VVHLKLNKQNQEAETIATAILFGGFGGKKTGTGTLTMTLNNGADGDLCGVSLSDGSRFSN
jgi:hypothetical protein